MKKAALPIFLLFLAPLAVIAQSPAVYEAASNHYQITSEVSQEHALQIGKNLDALFDLYNSFFRFDPAKLPGKLKVRIMANKQRYDEYLHRFVPRSRDDFTYLHYTDPVRCELVGYSGEQTTFRLALNHQAFIQFLRAFIQNPPLWIREGFAVFFESTVFDPATGQVQYQENLAWLDTLKAMAANKGEKLLPLQDLMKIDADGVRDNLEIFYPQAWGVVSFLTNTTDVNYSRLLWDSITALQVPATLEENEDTVYERVFKWYNERTLTADFVSYIESRKSFRSLVQSGIDLYSANSLEEAEKAFQEALKLDENNFVPYYYLGLIHYARKDYAAADREYAAALEKGAGPALIYYAMGINALADDRPDAALDCLKKAGDADPAYKQRAEDLSKRIKR
ncbi:MAG: tetratricopeptide repeat protein [Spirochaetales bacterium]|jgi:tetratricopeptide (TPR) repeat protein|nr:tetratricopeptide repeat protein [Spirochaetales bacterium]